MNPKKMSTDGLEHPRSGHEATTGVNTGPGSDGQPSAARRSRRRKGGEEPMVPEAEFRSYYGKPVLNQPVWQSPDIPGYIFLGGLAGVGSVIAAAAQGTGRPKLARASKLGSASAVGLSLAFLVHDLGRPGRFFNMLRTIKPTSPMSMGSWLLAAYGPAASLAAASELTGIASGLGTLATVGAAVLGPAVATYTAALISDTAVPAWHDGYRDMPFVFAASAISSAAGLAMVGAPIDQCGPVRMLGALGGGGELLAERVMERRMGFAAEAFEEGKAELYHRLAEPLLLLGTAGSIMGKRSRVVSVVAGAALLAGSALTRFSIFEAGLNSAADPKYTVAPQRERVERRKNGSPDR